jgi:hypothetical protein
VKRLLSILPVVLTLAACRPAAPAGTPLTGAPSSRGAVEGFLAAIRSQDIQGMSALWGTRGGAARDVGINRQQLEKRIIIMQCYLAHQQHRIVSEIAADSGRRMVRVALRKGDITRETNFTTVSGPSRRWYVESAELEAVKDLRREPPSICAGMESR